MFNFVRDDCSRLSSYFNRNFRKLLKIKILGMFSFYFNFLQVPLPHPHFIFGLRSFSDAEQTKLILHSPLQLALNTVLLRTRRFAKKRNFQFVSHRIIWRLPLSAVTIVRNQILKIVTGSFAKSAVHNSYENAETAEYYEAEAAYSFV